MTQAASDVDRRRREQDAQHGGSATDDRRTALEWNALLTKYHGRVADAALAGNHKAYRAALIDLAAVAQAAAEAFDRKGGM